MCALCEQRRTYFVCSVRPWTSYPATLGIIAGASYHLTGSDGYHLGWYLLGDTLTHCVVSRTDPRESAATRPQRHDLHAR